MLTAALLVSALVSSALANPLQGLVKRQADCHTLRTKNSCTGGTDCCWYTGGLHTATEGDCRSCRKVRAAELGALKDIWVAWKYPSNLPDANPDEILCPNLAQVANHRVACDDDGFLTDLTLGNDFLHGDLADLCKLIELPGEANRIETLTLSANFLFGNVPKCVATLTETKQFWIDHNFLRGPMPDLSGLVALNTDAPDCRLVSDNFLTTYFEEDNNCFTCGGGLDNLPEACKNLNHFPNKCLFFEGKTVTECPPVGDIVVACMDGSKPTASMPCPAPEDNSNTGGNGNDQTGNCPQGTHGCPCNSVTQKCQSPLACDRARNKCINAANALSASVLVTLACALLVTLLTFA